MKKQGIRKFIIVIIFIELISIFLSSITYGTTVNPNSYKPQMQSSSLIESDEKIEEINEPIISMKSKVT